MSAGDDMVSTATTARDAVRPGRAAPQESGRGDAPVAAMHLEDHRGFSTLGWIQPQIAELLSEARQALESYADAPADTGSMRSCVDLLHQVLGSLRMVELYGAAELDHEMEQLAAAILGGGVAARDEALAALMRGLVQLPDYLDLIDAGHKDIPIVLLPLLNDLRAARGVVPADPAALFHPDLDRTLPADADGARAAYPFADLRQRVMRIRSRFEATLGAWTPDRPPEFAALRDAVDELRATCNGAPARRLWWIAGAVLDALQQGAVEARAAGLRDLCERLGQRMRRVEDEGEEACDDADARDLARALLFRLAHAQSGSQRAAAVANAFGLDRMEPSDAELERARAAMSGRNRALLDTVARAVREDLLRVNEGLDIFLRREDRDAKELLPQADTLRRVGDTLAVLGLDAPAEAVAEQRGIITAIARGERTAQAETVLDVASALLYVDASLDEHIEHLGAVSSAGDVLPPSEARKITRALMNEAGADLHRVEDHINGFIESSWSHDQLAPVASLLTEVRGALQMLNLEHPAALVEGIRRYVDDELVHDRKVPTVEEMDQLADALAAVEYYLEAGQDARVGETRILDDAEQSLARLHYWPVPEARRSAVDFRPASAPAMARKLPEAPVIEITAPRNATPPTAPAAAPPAAATPPGSGPQRDEGAWEEVEERVLERIDGDGAPLDTSFQDAAGIDADIREVFIEEVGEEIANIDANLPAWRADPQNLDALKGIRRSFHTLKGSGRLVGATALGEFSWKIENMLNRVLDHTIPPSPEVRELVDAAAATVPGLHALLRGESAELDPPLDALMRTADKLAAGASARVADLMPEYRWVTHTVPRRVPAIDTAPVTPDTAIPVAPIEPTHPESAPASPDAVEPAGVPTTIGPAVPVVPEPLEPIAAVAAADRDVPVVDPALLEVLRAEVGPYLDTMRRYLARDVAHDVPVDDELARAVHTLHGAIAMVGVQSITPVLAPLESWIRRLRHAGLPLGYAGCAALRDATAMTALVVSQLDAPVPDIPDPTALAERLEALRDGALPVPSRAEVERAEQERVAAEQAERERVAAEKAEQERVAAEKAEQERVAAEKAEQERVAAEKAEQERVAAEKAEQERVAAEKAEQERVAAEKAEQERVAAEKAERERVAAEKAEQERAAAERAEQERVAAEKAEQERVAAEKAEQERVAAEKAEQERAEQERVAAEKAEQERVAAEEAEQERVAAEKAEQERVAAEKAEQERVAAEKAEQERVAAERAEQERVAAEKAEQERVAAERAEQERVAAEKAEQERAAAEKAEQERIAAEKAEQERAAAEKAEQERVAAEKAEQERVAAEKAEQERVAAEKAEQERVAAERAEQERVAAEKAEQERVAAEKAEQERIAAERAEQERLAAERAEQERLAAEQAEAERLAKARVEAERLLAASALPAFPADSQPDGPLALPDLDAELVELFTDEAGELMDASDAPMAALRAAPDDLDAMHGLQRSLHTLKGSARVVGLAQVGDLAHAMETLLEQVVGHRRGLKPIEVESLERGFDRLHDLVERVRQGRAIAAPANAIERFNALAEGRAIERGTAAAGPAPAPKRPEAVPDDARGEAHQAELIRVRSDLLDSLVNAAGEASIYRARVEQQVGNFRFSLTELEQTVTRLRDQLRKLEIETEAQILSRYQRENEAGAGANFDPLELDRFSNLQQYSRALAESVSDLASIQDILDDQARQSETLLLQQSRVNSDLQDGLMRTRMVPFDSLVPNLRRTLRGAADELGKRAQLKVVGAQGEMDRSVLERMKAPFEHMLRNALAHGIEDPVERVARGKPAEGTVTLRVDRQGTEVLVRVSDDGAGFDRDAILAKAIERGLLKPDLPIADADLFNFVLQTGFSTAHSVTLLAGRGVGMDVVANEIRQLGGSLTIESERGRGTTFNIRLPFTLAVAQAITVRSAEATFAIPMTSVQAISRIRPAELAERLASETRSVTYVGEEYALYDLSELLGFGPTPVPDEGGGQLRLMMVNAGDVRAAVRVDMVLGSGEVVVKPVAPQVTNVPGVFGATIRADGSVMLILDPAPLVRHHRAQLAALAAAAAAAPEQMAPVVPATVSAPETEGPRLVMVVDDSITMRKVTTRVLERAQYTVVTAKDGVDALEKLQERVPDLMLLDIEMPRMDGYELATHMRNDERFRRVPVIMITSRTGEKHRQRALEVGVEHYLGKPYSEADLLQHVRGILEAAGG